MIRNIKITLVLCLCVGSLFAQRNNNTVTPVPYNSQLTGYNYNGSIDDLRRKRSGELREEIRNLPEWKSEFETYQREFHNSSAWKKSYASSAESLKILGDHPGPKEYGIWREVVSKNHAELESSEAYKIYDAKLKNFNKRLDQEYRRRLAEEYLDPR
ncbi:MAG: hypothetical protein ABIN91_02705 [Mucilaginibacter sp.]|uniref:hypothetical protein n=1 Tax=Mucilaginibacter sp. TaxID=1882438 RepID=UPI0032637AA3